MAEGSGIKEQAGETAERRKSPRAAIRLGVHFRTAGELRNAIAATTNNISMGGLCLRTKRSYEPGARLELTIGYGEDKTLVVGAVVAWARAGKAIGVRFDGLTPEQSQTLRGLLQQQGA